MGRIKLHNDSFLKLGCMLLTFLFLKPESVSYLAPGLDQMLDIARVGFAVGILFLFIVQRRKINAMFICTLFYCGSFLISTVINDGELRSCIYSICDFIAFLMWLEVLMNKGTVFCLDVLLVPLEIMIFVNLVSILLFPNGMYMTVHYKWHSGNSWFLGYDNSHIRWFLPAITVSMLRSYFMNNSARITMRNFLLILMCASSLLICGQATSLVGMFILLLFIVFPRLFRNSWLLNIKNYIALVVIAFFGIVIFRLQSLLAPIIVSLLHKDLSFTGRVAIWDRALKYIAEKPWLGYGQETIEQTFARFGLDHAHNVYLQAFYEGGALRFLALVAMIILAAYHLIKAKNNIMSNYLSLALFSTLVLFLGDGFNVRFFFTVFFLSYKINQIIAEQKKYLLKYKSSSARRVRIVWSTAVRVEGDVK